MADEDKKNDFRLKRGEDLPDENGRVTRVIKREKRIREYRPPGFKKYSEGDDVPEQEMEIGSESSANLCCCDSVCACHSVDADSCGCHEVCTCHDVCTCDSECSCVSHTCSCVSHGTYYYTYTYTYVYY